MAANKKRTTKIAACLCHIRSASSSCKACRFLLKLFFLTVLLQEEAVVDEVSEDVNVDIDPLVDDVEKGDMIPDKRLRLNQSEIIVHCFHKLMKMFLPLRVPIVIKNFAYPALNVFFSINYQRCLKQSATFVKTRNKKQLCYPRLRERKRRLFMCESHLFSSCERHPYIF